MTTKKIFLVGTMINEGTSRKPRYSPRFASGTYDTQEEAEKAASAKANRASYEYQVFEATLICSFSQPPAVRTPPK